ncbi:MAG: Fic family protein [Gammaproteobacteria bacterium]|nr:MAG: Fic family protein [Gammaproteobacteria bacterium]
MTKNNDISGNPEFQYQPGSNEQVLLNKLGVTDADEMDAVEFDLLTAFQADLFIEVEIDQVITARDLCDWHSDWLGTVYEWAGHYRSIDMTDREYPVATADLIPGLMSDFEENFLSRYMPCNDMEFDQLVEALAVCHSELVKIHPFREGTRRLARVLATVMALQADMPPIDFDLMEKKKDRYLGALQAGYAGNYKPMKQVFSEVLNYSLEQAELHDSV